MSEITEEATEKNWLDEGPELLVQMAQKGEIDPWNVDLVFVIDKFLSQLKKGEGKQELKEAAHVIFFVSVLLRIKSQKIYVRPPEQAEINEDDPYGDLIDFEEIDFEELNARENLSQMLSPRALDTVLSRNPRGLKEPRKRKITLDDIINLFKQAESNVSKVKRKKKSSLEDFADEGDIVIREDEDTDIMELAHDENLEHKIQLLSEYILRTLEINRETPLSSLHGTVGDWVDTFLSALFLSHSGKTEMYQEKFYEEILLKRLA